MPDMCGGIAWPYTPGGDLCGEDPWCQYEPDKKSAPFPVPLDQTDLALLDLLQDDIPLVLPPV